MKRLFEVVGNVPKGEWFFENKTTAKSFRNETGRADRNVILGPDHWRYGVKGHPRTHSHAASGLSRKKGK
jgi:predicted class III extradiol MEMO1 family dioxygenase